MDLIPIIIWMIFIHASMNDETVNIGKSFRLVGIEIHFKIRFTRENPRSIFLLQQVPVMAQTYTLAMLDYLMAQNYSANTIKNYVNSFNLFLRINFYQNPDTLTEMQIVKHLAGMTLKGLSPSRLIFVFDF